MSLRLLPRLEDEIRRYATEHRGDRPLYVVMAENEADQLLDEVRQDRGFDDKTIVTELDGTKIIKHPAIKPGQMQLTNELPETSS